MGKYLIALEGPAGSGKTVTTHMITRENAGLRLLTRPGEFAGVRSYKNEMGPMQADIARALEMFYTDGRYYVSDRFWMSSVIYQKFKYGNGSLDRNYPSPIQVACDVVNLGQWITGFYYAAIGRDFALPVTTNLTLDFYVLLPTLELLERNRGVGSRNNSRSYPFPADEELLYYQNYIGSAQLFQNEFITIRFWPFNISNIDQYDKVWNRVERELSKVKV